ncbi:hypothetical protein SISNIDRAFT_136013 [Sistotremastrum niveocremeum HHB9708]|uniref:Uncharacterized protein n=1 Tax=Sistotremastrum niveocremeum HHB9708 TaxID=1314777 RepID=A0A164ZYQ6_9AGAM|nr:hypothetical protein SISNIDRAFT_136013 [Sistotremastrum niveocremeum HHB9708]
MGDSSRIPFADQIGRLTDIFEGCETIRDEGLKERLEDLASKYQYMLHHETSTFSPMLENTYRPKLDSHLKEFQSFIQENQGKGRSRGLGGLFGGGGKQKGLTVETLSARYQAFRKTIGLPPVASDKAFSIISGSSAPLIAPLQPPYSSSPPYLNTPLTWELLRLRHTHLPSDTPHQYHTPLPFLRNQDSVLIILRLILLSVITRSQILWN